MGLKNKSNLETFNYYGDELFIKKYVTSLEKSR